MTQGSLRVGLRGPIASGPVATDLAVMRPAVLGWAMMGWALVRPVVIGEALIRPLAFGLALISPAVLGLVASRLAAIRSTAVVLVLATAAGCRPAETSVPAPATVHTPAPPVGPASPTEEVEYTVLLKGRPVGTQRTVHHRVGEVEVHFAYSDRGRGPDLRSRFDLDDRGLPRRSSTTGHDYLGAEVQESFRSEDGRRRWSNRGETENEPADEPGFYVSVDAVPEETALLAVAALGAPGGTLELVPAGRVTATAVHTLQVTVGRDRETVVGVRLEGLGLSPQWVWLGPDRRLFARVSDWLTIVEAGWEEVVPTLSDAQERSDEARRSELAQALRDPSAAAIVVRDVTVFDARAGVSKPRQTVVVRGDRFTVIGPVERTPVPGDALVFDGRGRTMIPGLWDMHTHYSPDDGILHVAAGVTTIRDLANDAALIRSEIEAIASGRAIGPRIVAAGIIDGPGPYAGPTPVLVDTPEEARAAVEDYAEKGYPQVKIYSSVPPSLVPVIVEHAHARGLRVSGHVPAFMTAEQAVRAGYDELQHINFLVLNFLDPGIDTRTPARFSAVAEQAGDVDWSSAAGQDFVRLLAERKVVIDPTVTIFEVMFTARPGQMSAAYEAVADRLPLQVRRGFRVGGLPLSSGGTESEKWARREHAFSALLQLIARLDRAGVPIVAGTDALPGFTLHRELENYVRAGLTPARVLQVATLDSARVMGLDAEVGTIEAGKRADFVVVEGDPLADISALRNVVVTVTAGAVFRAERLETAMGMTPRHTPL